MLMFFPTSQKPVRPTGINPTGDYLLYNQCDGYHLAEARWHDNGEFNRFCTFMGETFEEDFYCAWALLPQTSTVLFSVFARRQSQSSAPTETIERVAIRYKGHTHSLPRPNRHHDVIRDIGGINGNDQQGFLTSSGRFVRREEALKIALAANQVLDPSNIRAGQLFSEDVW